MRIYTLLKQIKKRFHRLADEKGMSLVEVIAIVFLLSISVIPLTRMAMSNLDAARTYNNLSQGTFYAEGIMEEIMSDYLAGPANGLGYDWVIANWPGATDSPPTGFSGAVTVSAEDSIKHVRYVEVEVRVSCSSIPDIVLSTWLVEDD